MKDLSILFSEADQRAAKTSSAGALHDLVGPRGDSVPSQASSQARELAELFPADPESPAALSGADRTSGPDGMSDGADRLIQFVGAESRARRISRESGAREWLSPDQARAGSRALLDPTRRGRLGNWLSVSVAVLAAVALVTVTGFALVQRATSNPAVEAMVSLREREAELRNDLQTLRTAAGFYEDAVAEGVRLSDLATPIFASLAGKMDAGPLQAAEQQRARLASAVATPQVVVIPEYERPKINESSLASVGKALDAVRKVRDMIPSRIEAVRDARSSLASALGDFRSSLRDVGSNIESVAVAQTESNAAADEGFRTAVRDAVSKLREVQLAGGDGLADISAYAEALNSLRAENARELGTSGTTSQPSRNSSSGGGQATTPPVNTGNGGSDGSQSNVGTTQGTSNSTDGGASTPTPTDSTTSPSVSPSLPPTGGLPGAGTNG
ncbi:hypothetical protein [Microbacterium sp. RURRCA19A]|uniref:hypothetical protein n=1 Tax=Microbacterium sp. RURRCA19A TaxID=1907391 RepID=UPI0009548280|nr:hypothetical protein [Microbacterium sp. RURRCA19A]SIR78370.1 hypothetical protein SAMN05880568_1450 [Microbacterium sp. RURRCA19A]